MPRPIFSLVIGLVIICLPAIVIAQDLNVIRSVRWERSELTYDYSPDPKGHLLFEARVSTDGTTLARAVGFLPMQIGQFPGVGLRINHRHGVDGVMISIADQRHPISTIPMFIDQRLTITFGRRTEITQVIESYGQSVPQQTLLGFATELSSHANRDLSQRLEFFVQGNVYPFGALRGQAGLRMVEHPAGRHLDRELGFTAQVSLATHIYRMR